MRTDDTHPHPEAHEHRHKPTHSNMPGRVALLGTGACVFTLLTGRLGKMAHILMTHYFAHVYASTMSFIYLVADVCH